MNKRLILCSLPLLLFIPLLFLFWHGLGLDPKLLPTALINKTVPKFDLATLDDLQSSFQQHDLIGKVSLVNYWATWCFSCRIEHAILQDIAHSGLVPIYGIDYKDNFQQARQWLTRLGNPYNKIGFDAQGHTALDWGVYGTPETFVVDQQGIIRYRHVGALNRKVWRTEILPLVIALKHQQVARQNSQPSSFSAVRISVKKLLSPYVILSDRTPTESRGALQ